LLIDPTWRVRAAIVSHQFGVVAGLPLAALFLKTLDPAVRFESRTHDGTWVRPGQTLAVLYGKARSILSGERPALNALQHLSGIATLTRAQVVKLHGTGVRLYDTRKTLPGWRFLQKYAVRCGGAHNQRMSLSDAIMIKENHLRVVRLARRDWADRVRELERKRPSTLVQIEVQTQRDLRDAVLIKPRRVLLDNLPPTKIKRMIRYLRDVLPGVEIEITGGITPQNLRRLAKLHPNRISMGRLTHSVPAFDCSLDILHVDTD